MTEEAVPKKLTIRNRRFIDEYLRLFNVTQSAINAGYSEKTAYSIGWELLRKPEIKEEIDRRLDEVRLGKPEVLRLLSDIAHGDMGEFLDIGSMGFSLDLQGAKEKGMTKLIKKVKQKTTTFLAKKESEEDREVHEIEIELYDAQGALVTLGKHHGLLTEKLDVTSLGKEISLKVDKTDEQLSSTLASLATIAASLANASGAGISTNPRGDAPNDTGGEKK
jgi:phage terminase small subunit